jgi:antitoxin ParD1/3/4
MADTVGFRRTVKGEVIKAAMHGDEHASDVTARTLRRQERESWLARANADAGRVADEDLSDERDAW